MELSKKHILYWLALAVPSAAFFIAFAMPLMSGSGEAATGTVCNPVNGHIDAVVVPKDSCTSQFGLCTRGKFIGGIQGDFNFTVSSFNSSPDPKIPFVALYTGDIVIQTTEGDLFGAEAGGFNTDPVGDGEFGELLTVTGGTGDMEGASGHIAVFGNVNLVTGIGSSDYKGELCTVKAE